MFPSHEIWLHCILSNVVLWQTMISTPALTLKVDVWWRHGIEKVDDVSKVER